MPLGSVGPDRRRSPFSPRRRRSSGFAAGRREDADEGAFPAVEGDDGIGALRRRARRAPRRAVAPPGRPPRANGSAPKASGVCSVVCISMRVGDVFVLGLARRGEEIRWRGSRPARRWRSRCGLRASADRATRASRSRAAPRISAVADAFERREARLDDARQELGHLLRATSASMRRRGTSARTDRPVPFTITGSSALAGNWAADLLHLGESPRSARRSGRCSGACDADTVLTPRRLCDVT